MLLNGLQRSHGNNELVVWLNTEEGNSPLEVRRMLTANYLRIYP